MGLFDKFKKKESTPSSEPIIDENQLDEVAAYQSKDHQVIKDLEVKHLVKDT